MPFPFFTTNKTETSTICANFAYFFVTSHKRALSVKCTLSLSHMLTRLFSISASEKAVFILFFEKRMNGVNNCVGGAYCVRAFNNSHCKYYGY